MTEGTIQFKGTERDRRMWMCRLLNKYDKDARLIDVIMKEYGCSEVRLI